MTTGKDNTRIPKESGSHYLDKYNNNKNVKLYKIKLKMIDYEI